MEEKLVGSKDYENKEKNNDWPIIEEAKIVSFMEKSTQEFVPQSHNYWKKEKKN